MSQSKTREVYEQLEPYMQEMERDTLMSKHLAEKVDIPKNVIGEELKEASNSAEYDIEVIDKWPYKFTNPFSEGLEGIKLKDVGDKDQKILKRTLQIMEAKSRQNGDSGLRQNERYEIFNHFLDYKDLSRTYEKSAELEEKLEDLEDVRSELENPNSKIFYLSE